MKRLLVPMFIFAVVVLGYAVYQDNQMKKRQEVDQLIQDAHQSLKVVEGNPNNTVLDPIETTDTHSASPLQVKSRQF
jgi:predicted negative regulator of RcsB-dependent stress response